MNLPAATLRELHRIHRQLTDLRERLDSGPKQVTAAETNVKKAEEEVARAKDLVKQSKLTASQKELQLKEREARIKDLQRKLNECQSNREFTALKEQIAADLQANSVQSDEVIEVLDKIEDLQKKVVDAEQGVARAKEELAKVKQRVNDQQGLLEVDVARLSTELKSVEVNLEGDFRREYDRLVKAKGENAMAEVDGVVCGGCFFSITAQQLNELGLSKPVFCKSCGRLLYLPEDRSPLAAK